MATQRQTNRAIHHALKRTCFLALIQKHWPIHQLKSVIELLAAGTNSEILIQKYSGHALSTSSPWKDSRELHVDGLSGNWLLIYKIDQQNLILTLVRTGSHKKLLGI
jgi:mRNA interferase YafQ